MNPNTDNEPDNTTADESRDAAREILLDGIENGASPLDILDQISGVFDGDLLDLLPY